MKTEKSKSVPIMALILCCLAFIMLSYITCSRLGRMASVLAQKSPRTIVLDAGHGGEDGGASGCSQVPEKVINLKITQDLQQLLQPSGFHVVMTRTNDTSISDNLDTIHERKVSDLHNRMKIIQSQENCIFVSIHQNQFPQSRYHGAQIFYSKNNGESKILAETIKSRIVGLLQNDNTREIKPATSSIYLLWNSQVPSILVECGFLSNEEECELLNNEDYQHKIAFSIYCGLMDYCSTQS